MKYVQKRLEPENNFNKIKIKKKPEKKSLLNCVGQSIGQQIKLA